MAQYGNNILGLLSDQPTATAARDAAVDSLRVFWMSGWERDCCVDTPKNLYPVDWPLWNVRYREAYGDQCCIRAFAQFLVPQSTPETCENAVNNRQYEWYIEYVDRGVDLNEVANADQFDAFVRSCDALMPVNDAFDQLLRAVDS